MCYNVAYLERKAAKYNERYKGILTNWGESMRKDLRLMNFVNGFEHPILPVITSNGFAFFQWGLIPSWVKDELFANDIRNKTLNAVGETVFEKPSFRSSIISRRCILPIGGFYEWRDFNKVKYPYFVHLKSEKIFSAGGIYDSWTDKETGEVLHTFSILTTPANPLMEKIHNLKKRMPLIIPKEQESNWIDLELTKEQIRDLILPYPDSDMEAYTISRDANKAGNDRNIPEILEPVEYPELIL